MKLFVPLSSGADIPVHAAVCFVDAEFRLFSKPFQLNQVWVIWGKKLAEMIAEEGDLSHDDVLRVATGLATALPPKIPTP